MDFVFEANIVEPWPVSSTMATCTRAQAGALVADCGSPGGGRDGVPGQAFPAIDVAFAAADPAAFTPPAGRATPARSPPIFWTATPWTLPAIWRSAPTRRWTMSSTEGQGGPCWWLRRWRETGARVRSAALSGAGSLRGRGAGDACCCSTVSVTGSAGGLAGDQCHGGGHWRGAMLRRPVAAGRLIVGQRSGLLMAQ